MFIFCRQNHDFHLCSTKHSVKEKWKRCAVLKLPSNIPKSPSFHLAVTVCNGMAFWHRQTKLVTVYRHKFFPGWCPVQCPRVPDTCLLVGCGHSMSVYHLSSSWSQISYTDEFQLSVQHCQHWCGKLETETVASSRANASTARLMVGPVSNCTYIFMLYLGYELIREKRPQLLNTKKNTKHWRSAKWCRNAI